MGMLLCLTYSNNAGQLMDVKRGHKIAFAGYPALRYYFQISNEVLGDQKNKWRTYIFKADLIYMIGKMDKDTAEQILEDAMEAVLNVIDADYTLGGYADNSDISTDPIREIDSPYGNALLLPITIQAQVLLYF